MCYYYYDVFLGASIRVLFSFVFYIFLYYSLLLFYGHFSDHFYYNDFPCPLSYFFHCIVFLLLHRFLHCFHNRFHQNQYHHLLLHHHLCGKFFLNGCNVIGFPVCFWQDGFVFSRVYFFMVYRYSSPTKMI
jgi:hypothetical protein